MWALVWVYVLRMIVMMCYAFSIKFPVIIIKKVSGVRAILKYSSLIIIAGSVASIFLDIDKVMLGSYIAIEDIAYYNVAIFISAVIAVPQRAMHQILMPLTAKYLNEKDFTSLDDLYKRSSLNLFIVGGLIFLLIVLNINELYHIIPKPFSSGLFIVFMISIAKLYDALLGSNNAIIFNSDYYRIILILGVVLVILMVVLNIIFIPLYGMYGAGLATFIAILSYNTIKLFFVKKWFKILPFTAKTFKIAGFIFFNVLLFYFWDFQFHPVINMGLKSLLITAVYVVCVYRFNFSEDITALVNTLLRR